VEVKLPLSVPHSPHHKPSGFNGLSADGAAPLYSGFGFFAVGTAVDVHQFFFSRVIGYRVEFFSFEERASAEGTGDFGFTVIFTRCFFSLTAFFFQTEKNNGYEKKKHNSEQNEIRIKGLLLAFS
jgi:hypothetical protein